MADKNYTTVGLGELLWDMFPEGKQLGGAPANFAYMTRLLGDEGIVASRVGSDARDGSLREARRGRRHGRGLRRPRHHESQARRSRVRSARRGAARPGLWLT